MNELKSKVIKLNKLKEVEDELKGFDEKYKELKSIKKELTYQLSHPEKCEICNVQFKSFKTFYRHYGLIHKPFFECTICRLKFKTLEERNKHDLVGCRCTKWFITNKQEIKPCSKIFTKTKDKIKHNCSGFKTKDQAERALEFRNKNRNKTASECSIESVPESEPESASEDAESEPIVIDNVNITIESISKDTEPEPKSEPESKTEPFDHFKPRIVTKDFLYELEEAGVLYNPTRTWNMQIEPYIQDYLEKTEVLIYHNRYIYSECHNIFDFDEEKRPQVFVLYDDEFKDYEHDSDSE